MVTITLNHQAKYSSADADGTQKKVKTSKTGLADSKLGYNSSTDELGKDAAKQDKEKPSVMTFKEIHETDTGTDKKG